MLSRRKFGALAGATAVAAAAAAKPAAAQQATALKMQTMWQAGTINQKIVENFCEQVKGLSNGRLTLEPLAVGTIVAYGETLDAMQNGILDAHQSSMGYFTGKEPALALLGDLNGGYENPYQMQMWFEYGGGLQLAREIYQRFDVFYVGPVWWGVESVPAKKPLKSVADFKGVKMRVPEGMGAEVWRRTGAGVVTLPGSEVYTALERGVIEATDWGTLGMNQDLGYHKIAGYPLYPGFHSMPASEVAIAMPKWKALPKDIQLMLEVATRDLSREMIQRVMLEDLKAAAEARAQGVNLVDWTPEERRNFRKLAQEVWADWAKKSPASKKVYESQVAFLKRLQLID